MLFRSQEVVERIHQATQASGAVDEAEYEDAKNEQAFIEGRILQLDQMLRNAQVIDNHNAPRDTITVGSTVRVKDMGSGEEISYTIVGSAEADPDKDKISNESPVGRALLGRRTGEVVEVTVPAGKMKYSVLKIIH